MSDPADRVADEAQPEPASAEPMAVGPAPEPAGDEPAPESAPGDNRLEYDGAAGPIAKIAVSNALRTLATLGAYRFWGKTRLRRYLWSRVSFLGDAVEYTGTGRELLLGFIAAIVVLGLLAGSLVGIEMATGIDHPLYWTAQAIYTVGFVFLVYVAEYRARRYRLSRTEWRGIRFAQDGSSVRYALLALGWLALNLLTLGAAYGIYRTRLQRYRTTHTSFGSLRFEFEGRAAELVKAWLFAWFLLLPTLGLAYIWYRVWEFRRFAGRTRCGGLSFDSSLATGTMIRIVVGFGLLTLLLLALLFGTLLAFVFAVAQDPVLMETIQWVDARLPFGLGALDLVGYVVALAVFLPVMAVLRVLFLIHPLFRHVLPSIRVIGEEDYEAIAQSAQSMPRQGEGLADALDVGAV